MDTTCSGREVSEVSQFKYEGGSTASECVAESMMGCMRRPLWSWCLGKLLMGIAYVLERRTYAKK